jgi:hypothetical protein
VINGQLRVRTKILAMSSRHKSVAPKGAADPAPILSEFRRTNLKTLEIAEGVEMDLSFLPESISLYGASLAANLFCHLAGRC